MVNVSMCPILKRFNAVNLRAGLNLKRILAKLEAKEIKIIDSISRSPLGSFCRVCSSRFARIILVYHGVDPKHPGCLKPELFVDQINYVKQHYKLVPLKTIYHCEGDGNEGLLLSVTFDDAYKNFYDYAFPILKRFNAPATVYAPTEYIGLQNEWDKGREELLSIMRVEELRDISSEGIEIGSHGSSHRRLRGLERADLKKEVIDSKNLLEDRLDRAVRSFAFPHGGRCDFDKLAMEVVREAGYDSAVTTIYGRCNDWRNKYELRRIIVFPTDTLNVFERKLNGHYDWLIGKEWLAYQLRSLLQRCTT